VSDRPMAGVRVLEVAQFTFTPAAGAILADWGADVIKVEHAQTGDSQRGHRDAAGWKEGQFHPIIEHPNRGKRSIGLSLEHPEALDILYGLVKSTDIFLTNFLPDARVRLRIDVEHIREVNPDIIYARGSAFGPKGPEARKGGYDASAYWARGGSSFGMTSPDMDSALGMPAPAYGDSLGGMAIAGGIAAALFSRAVTGSPSVVDVSLLSVGAWANALPIDISLARDQAWPGGLYNTLPRTNPVVGQYRTSDGRFIMLSMLQPSKWWKDFCRHLGRPDLVDDPRGRTGEDLLANASELSEIVASEISSRTFAYWVERFRTLDGPWAPVQNTLEVGYDPQLRANGYIGSVTDPDGNERELVANPILFDETAAQLSRAPMWAEHTDLLLHELGFNDDAILKLKIADAVT
jgi:crotonobetainyl-CoA:carnitine CoA-transferase CaiB-like acyl-CoA transferase